MSTSRGGEHVLIRPARPEDVTLYRDFLTDVNAEDLRLRFFARIAELTAAEVAVHEWPACERRCSMVFLDRLMQGFCRR